MYIPFQVQSVHPSVLLISLWKNWIVLKCASIWILRSRQLASSTHS